MPLRAKIIIMLAFGVIRTPSAYAAPADCSEKIDALSGSLDSVADTHMRAVLENDVRQARKEAAEGDEDECADIMAHASKVQSQAR